MVPGAPERKFQPLLTFHVQFWRAPIHLPREKMQTKVVILEADKFSILKINFD